MASRTEFDEKSRFGSRTRQPLPLTRQQHADKSILVSRDAEGFQCGARSDGTIDDDDAWNQERFAGVTPENNATVVRLPDLGPGVNDVPIRAAYPQELEIAAWPLEGNCLRPIDEFYPQDSQLSNRRWDDLAFGADIDH